MDGARAQIGEHADRVDDSSLRGGDFPIEQQRAFSLKVLERMGTLQAQYAPSTYVGLWSRVVGLEREAVTRALQRGSLVQASLMRSTIHVVSRRDFWPLAIALRAERKAWSRRVQGTDDRELRRAAERLRRALAHGPRTAKELGAPQVQVAEELEAVALKALQERHPERVLATNVEYYSAIVLDVAEIPPPLAPAMFACSRVAGWSAHILEQKRTGRLFRPSARYVGPAQRPASSVDGAPVPT